MRITLLCNLDIASNLAANRLIAALPEHDFSVLMTAQVGSKNNRPKALEALSFYESTLFTQILFPALISRKAVGEKGVSGMEVCEKSELLTFDAMKQRGVDVYPVSEINEGNGLSVLRRCQPDLILSVRFGRILKKPALDVPKHGVLNLHSGLLPQYRGIMATFWSMLKDEPQIGCTLHRIQDEGIDTGDILSTHPINTDYNLSYFDNMLAIYPAGLDAMIAATKRIANRAALVAMPQDSSQANYYGLPDHASISIFEQKGYRLIMHDNVIRLAQRFFTQ
jgi:methionyl-tRNA formyltransferase